MVLSPLHKLLFACFSAVVSFSPSIQNKGITNGEKGNEKRTVTAFSTLESLFVCVIQRLFISLFFFSFFNKEY